MHMIIAKNRLLFSGRIKEIRAYLTAIEPASIPLKKYIDQNLR